MSKTASRKISFITTVYNESLTITSFLDSLFAQTKLPNEIIIVDGGSRDETVSLIKEFEQKAKKKKITFQVFVKKGNRSIGRNEAIKRAHGEIIACSDAGNILDKEWIENIIQPFADKKVDVVAGYYKGKVKTIFQKCLLPFAFVMPDKVNPDTFLPSTRSIAFTKKIWEKSGGFDEYLSHNEDYAFSRTLKEKGAHIVFAKNAIVSWIPRNTFREAYIMFFRFAYGDIEAHILRSKVILLFARYILALYLIFLCLLYKSILGTFIIFALIVCYIFWSIMKNYRYVKDYRAFYFLPALQFTADAAVLSGTTVAYIKKIIIETRTFSFRKNWFLILMVFSYISILLSTLHWGIPNREHPFPYHMDEWHQLQAVGNTFRYGTPNTDGSANGTMFHFIASGIYLIPFTLLDIVNPFELQIDNWMMRERIFEVLRLQTIIIGVLSLLVLYKITSLIKASQKISLFLFACAPIWLALSGYFKYDIALLFWMLLSLFCLLRFAQLPTTTNYLIAAVPIFLAVSVKVSAIPLLPLYVLSFFLFSPSWGKNMKVLFVGIGICLCGIILFGMPDTLFGRGNILYYLYDNILHTPQTTANYQVGIDPYSYLFLHHLPLMFGPGLTVAFILAGIYLFVSFFQKTTSEKKVIMFLFGGLSVFITSLLPLKFMAIGNRSLVLLPFIVLIVGFAWREMLQNQRLKKVCMFLLPIIISLQLYSAFAWMSLKTVHSPQEIASAWLESNILADSFIGIENIPIYQYLPHLVQKEYYFKQYNINYDSKYRYHIIDSIEKRLPPVIIITNESMEKELIPDSPKSKLVDRLKKEGYRKKLIIKPDLTYYSVLGNEHDFYLAGIVTVPITTSIYIKP